APSALTAAAFSATEIHLAWKDNATNEVGFKVERSMDGTNFTQVAQVQPNGTTFRNVGLLPATVYSYRVRAFNSGSGSDSNVASAGTPTLCLSGVSRWTISI